MSREPMTHLFDIHGLVTISCPRAPDWLQRHLRGRLSAATATATDGVGGGTAVAHQDTPRPGGREPDIILLPLEGHEQMPAGSALLSSPYQMLLHPFRGRRSILVLHRGRPGLVFVPGRRVEIHYRPEPSIRGRLNLFLLFAISLAMRYNRGLLFHGAAAVRNDTCLLLVGLRGSGKSQIFLHLLRHGWRFLADDKLLLHRGRAHLLAPLVGLSDHHLLLQPWLAAAPGLPAFFRPPLPRLRARLHPLLRCCPPPLLPFARRILSPSRQVPVHCLLPDVGVEPLAAVTHLVLLENGRDLALAAGEEGVIRRCALVQDLVFFQMEPFIRLLRFCDWTPPAPEVPILDANLGTCRRALLRVPWGCEVAAAAREIETWLASR